MTATNNNILCDLSHLGLLEISGADAVAFLQGQVTNDVKLLTGHNAHYTAYCSPKGRMLALFLAFSHLDRIHLQLNRVLLEPISKRLKMYVLRSKVEIKDASESIIKFGIDGPEASQILASSLAKIPVQDYELVSGANATVLKLPAIAGHSRFEIFTDSANAPNIWETLKAHCRLAGKPDWDWLEIQAGIPDIELKTQEQFVPQMLNLDLLHAINFKKGCYTGQEIVARTHYLGSVKRRTYLTSIYPESQSDSAPQAGDKVTDEAKNEVGQIVRVAANASGGFDALVEMRIDALQAGNVYWNHTPVIVKPLPYSLET
jgi:tRNA-modifying protein YgfZ